MRSKPLLSILLFCTTFALADDWPQWQGPQRDGIWREKGIAQVFPAGGPPVRWRAPLGAGYSGPAVAAGKVFVLDRTLNEGTKNPDNPFKRSEIPGQERIVCLDAKTGKQLWAVAYDCPYTISYASGPRATPTVDVPENRVYTLGAEGHFYCVDIQSGKVIWNHKLDSPTPIWGFASHPLIDGDKVIVINSGEKALVTAFNKRTGAVIWNALAAREPGYSAPVIYQAGGVRQLMVFYPEGVVSLDPQTGQKYWFAPHGPVRHGVSITTPVKNGDRLYVSSSNEGGSMFKLSADKPQATLLWRKGGKDQRRTDSLHCLMAPPVFVGDCIFGACISGPLRCISANDGGRIWEDLRPTRGGRESVVWYTAFITPVQENSHYLIANEDGDLISAKLSPAGYQELSRAHLLDPTNRDPRRPVVWSHPAYSNKCIFWRNDKEMICASLAP